MRTTKECSQERMRLVRRLIELRLQLVMVTELKAFENENPITNSKVIFGHHFSVVWKPHRFENKYCDVCTKTIWKYMHQVYECTGNKYINKYIYFFIKVKKKYYFRLWIPLPYILYRQN